MQQTPYLTTLQPESTPVCAPKLTSLPWCNYAFTLTSSTHPPKTKLIVSYHFRCFQSLAHCPPQKQEETQDFELALKLRAMRRCNKHLTLTNLPLESYQPLFPKINFLAHHTIFFSLSLSRKHTQSIQTSSLVHFMHSHYLPQPTLPA